MFKFLIGALTGFCLMLPIAAQAQDIPSYATGQFPADANIHGRVVGFDGGYSLSVRDEKGYIDDVRLHPGTIINPTGLTLAPGMVVSVLGYNAGNYFSANEIDTPYQFYNGYAYYSGHPWNYYGPSITLGFFFGNAGWWHGGYFRGGYHYNAGVRIYNSVHVGQVYRNAGAQFHGRDVVAPREQGGYYHPGAPHGGFSGGHDGGEHGGGARGGGGRGGDGRGGEHGGGGHGGGDRH
jgi:hypothetical protein